MKQVIKNLEDKTGLNLAHMPFEKIADDYILTIFVASQDETRAIDELFVKFMTEDGFTILQNEPQIGKWFYNMVLAHIVSGPLPVQNKSLFFPTEIPPQYQSFFKEETDARMTIQERNFLARNMHKLIDVEDFRAQIIEIAFALMSNIKANGLAEDGYRMGENVNGADLFHRAENIIETHATQEEKLAHWMRPNEWKKHLDFFSELYQNKRLNLREFFSKIENKPLSRIFLSNLFDSNFHKKVKKALKTGDYSYLG